MANEIMGVALEQFNLSKSPIKIGESVRIIAHGAFVGRVGEVVHLGRNSSAGQIYVVNMEGSAGALGFFEHELERESDVAKRACENLTITRVNVHLAPDADPSRIARILLDKVQESARSCREPTKDLAARHAERNRSTHIAVLARALFRTHFRAEIVRRAEATSTHPFPEHMSARNPHAFDDADRDRIIRVEEIMWNRFRAARRTFEEEAAELVACMNSWPDVRSDR